jgi:hypothetical protein
MRRVLVAFVACCWFTIGCSSGSDTGSQVDDAQAASDDSATDTATMDDMGMPDTANAPKPATPTMNGVMVMSGSLHVSWTLNDTGLSSVELWRKDGSAGTYAKVYTLAGTATSKMDTTATNTSTTYCYQLKTIKGGVASDFSNEKCGTP